MERSTGRGALGFDVAHFQASLAFAPLPPPPPPPFFLLLVAVAAPVPVAVPAALVLPFSPSPADFSVVLPSLASPSAAASLALPSSLPPLPSPSSLVAAAPRVDDFLGAFGRFVLVPLEGSNPQPRAAATLER